MYGFNKVPVLSKGAHYQPEDGMCIMELVSFINRERFFSDSPKCTDDRIAVYMQNTNDSVTDEERVKLLSVIDRIFHTGEMTWEQRVDFNEELRNVWPELKPLLDEHSRLSYESAMHHPDRLVPTAARIWEFLYNLSMGSESVDVKLAVLNKVLDAADRALGVEETPPQNREEIEKMLAEVQR